MTTFSSDRERALVEACRKAGIRSRTEQAYVGDIWEALKLYDEPAPIPILPPWEELPYDKMTELGKAYRESGSVVSIYSAIRLATANHKGKEG